MGISSPVLGLRPGQLDAVTGFQSNADFLKKPLDHVFGFALVEAELLK
jgi:hypothetical protein